LNSQADVFYCKYACAIFPEAIEANEKELAEVSEKEMEIRSKPGLYDNGKGMTPVIMGQDLVLS